MRIALISYEYPPDTAFGGIATYTQQWAKALQSYGFSVEVFCASINNSISHYEDDVWVNRIKELDRARFKHTVLHIFQKRHLIAPFNYIESPEFNADGLFIKLQFPELPLIVKLHGPSFMIDKLNQENNRVSFLNKLRTILGAYRRFKKPRKYWLNREEVYKYEKRIISIADFITSPSLSLRLIVSDKFKIPINKIFYLPNPYEPNDKYLSIVNKSEGKIISYIGRLENRKGILTFIEVIPEVLKRFPDAQFRFVGQDAFINSCNISAKKILQTKLESCLQSITFVGHIPLEKMTDEFSACTICVFPSLWENFPTVCLEAMASGKAIIGSLNGGMNDMLSDPEAGILIDPSDSKSIINAICFLLDNPNTIKELGSKAKKSVIEKYNSSKIIEDFKQIILI